MGHRWQRTKKKTVILTISCSFQKCSCSTTYHPKCGFIQEFLLWLIHTMSNLSFFMYSLFKTKMWLRNLCYCQFMWTGRSSRAQCWKLLKVAMDHAEKKTAASSVWTSQVCAADLHCSLLSEPYKQSKIYYISKPNHKIHKSFPQANINSVLSWGKKSYSMYNCDISHIVFFLIKMC